MNPEIKNLINRGALFVINHSGGKDSQAMQILLESLVPVDQLLVIHADLPGADWPGIQEHLENTVQSAPIQVIRAVKTFWDMVQHRGMWPSPKNRQCTSDLKRGPIEKAIRHELKRRGKLLIVNCMGMRAEESSGRAKLETFKLNPRNSKAGREWFDWLPIHHYSEVEVFATIKAAGQKPHWAYEAGMSRLSCMFCIMASQEDLKTAARIAPDAYRRYCAMERTLDMTFSMPSKGVRKFLPEVTGINPE